MKIIQSFWTGNHRDIAKTYGWMSAKYNYLGWILSANQLRKFYDELILFTDEFGYELLIKNLKLPYTHVHVVLDELNKYDDHLWALAKIKSYQSMTEPFLHVDGDVFIWKEFDPELLKNDIIVQNIEYTLPYYQRMWSNIRPALSYLPPVMQDYHADRDKAYNMGIFGGNDLDFIGRYCSEAFDFVRKNTEAAEKIKDFNFNIFFEQVLFHRTAEQQNKNIACLIDIEEGQNPYEGLDVIDKVPDYCTYLHFLGPYKTYADNIFKIEAYVQKYYPEYYGYLEQMLGISPRLDGFEFDYRKETVSAWEHQYKKNLINRVPPTDDEKAIFCRNMSMVGNLGKLTACLESGEPFYLLRSSFFSVGQDSLYLEMPDYYLEIDLTMCSRLVLNIVDGCITNIEFDQKAMNHKQEDFDQNTEQVYLWSLWRKVERLASFGIILILTKQEYKTINIKAKNTNS